MAIMIHPVHRRLAELQMINDKRSLTNDEASDMIYCMKVNAKLVQDIDGLKELSYVAQSVGQMDWVQDITLKLDEMEAKFT